MVFCHECFSDNVEDKGIEINDSRGVIRKIYKCSDCKCEFKYVYMFAFVSNLKNEYVNKWNNSEIDD